MKSVKSTAPGKVILIGEHAVVYGHSAIACPISLTSTVVIKECTCDCITFIHEDKDKEVTVKLSENDENIPQYIKSTTAVIRTIFEKYTEDRSNTCQISISSDIPIGCGFGSSAALSVAFSKSFVSFFKLDEDVLNIAIETDSFFHGGKASGLDVHCSFANRAIRFRNGKIEESFELKYSMILIYTGISRSTADAVQLVAEKKRNDPKRIEKIFNDIEKLTSILCRDQSKHQQVFSSCQTLLRELEISNEVIDEMIDELESHYDLKIKITGAGLGGSLVALIKDGFVNAEIVKQIQKRLVMINREAKTYLSSPASDIT